MVLALAYLSVGWVQRTRAEALLARVAASHGAAIERGGAKPTFGNLLLWRGVWQSGDTLHVVALRPGVFGPDRVSPVATAPRFVPDRDVPMLRADDRQARDIARFERFSAGWLVRLPAEHGVMIGDLRYAMLPDRIDPLWAIRLDVERPHEHVDYVTRRQVVPDTLERFSCMIRGACLAPLSRSGR